MGITVSGRVWIHFFVSDVAGFNVWLGHYNSSSQLMRPYRDCHCCFYFMNHVRHRCVYVTLEEMRQARCRKASAMNEEEKKAVFRNISKHDIENAFTLPHMPLSNLIHGIFKMSPPEILHTSGTGIIKYVFQNMDDKLSAENKRQYFSLHCRVCCDMLKQSKTDFPWRTNRTSPLDGSKS